MATTRSKRATATNNPDLGPPMIPLEEHAVLNGVTVQEKPVIVQIRDGKVLGVLAGAKVRNRVTVTEDGEKVKTEIGGHTYRVSTPTSKKDGVFAPPEVMVDGAVIPATFSAARWENDDNQGKNICARWSVVVPLAERQATVLATDEAATIDGGFLIVVVKDRLTAKNSRPGTIEVTGFSSKAERPNWNV